MEFWGKTRIEYKRRIRVTNKSYIKNENNTTVEVEHLHWCTVQLR